MFPITRGRDAALPVAVLCGLLSPSSVHAQGVGQRAEKPDDVIVVEGRVPASRTAIGAETAREQLLRVPGAVGLVEREVFADDFAQSIGDALLFTPGVFADTSAQREARLSVRGSGLNASFERRGLTVRRDGVPISRASGITEFQEVDPLTIDYIEVYKGANGLEYGAASLGGAINIVTPTGLTRKETARIRIEGGSFGTARVSASLAGADGPWDAYAGTTALRADGFRDQSEVRSVYHHSNLGYRFESGVETRFYLTALQDNFELAGSLQLDEALNDREAAARPVTIGPFFPGGPVTVLDPGPVADDWDRNLGVFRLANKTVFSWGGAKAEISAWHARRDLDHAITRFAGIIGQDEAETGAALRVSGEMAIAGRRADYLLGAEATASSNRAERYDNLTGERGALSSLSDQDARNLLGFAQLSLPLTDRLTAIAGAQYLSTLRDAEGVLNASSGRKEEDGFNPRFGLLYDAGAGRQIFFNVSRSFEPAGISDLTAGGVLDFTPLPAQRAVTAEIGTRGRARFAAWDIALYRSTIEGEFIDLAQEGFAGAVSATFNADETVHRGVEAGLDLFITPKSFERRGVSFLWRHIYTFNDFFFTSDPQDLEGVRFAFDGNRLAGVPRHIYVSEIKAEHERYYAAANLRHIPEGPFADYANTQQVPGYTLYGLTAGFSLTERAEVFASAENLTDERYISNLAAVADLSLQDDPIFTPGQGRAVFGGLRLVF